MLMHKPKGVSRHLCGLEMNMVWIMLTEAVTSEKKGAPAVEQNGEGNWKKKRSVEKNVISPSLEICLSQVITPLIIK